MKAKKVITIMALIIIVALLATIAYGYYKKLTEEVKNPIATIEVEGFGTIKVELYPDMAPNTVANFIRLSNRGFYDNLTFHRTIPDFMIQGGDKTGTGSGNASLSDLQDNVENDKAYCIPGEFISNGYTKNTLKHERGVISMARGDYSSLGLTSEGYNSASSQFFIVTQDKENLDGIYTSFGRVTEGMEVVDAISNVEVVTRDSEDKENSDKVDKPVNPPVIKSVRVETFGVDYGIPTTQDIFDYTKWLNEHLNLNS